MELPPAKLIGLQVYDDALTLHDQTELDRPSFAMDPGWPEAFAATINALTETGA
jgi:hypothetical protein